MTMERLIPCTRVIIIGWERSTTQKTERRTQYGLAIVVAMGSELERIRNSGKSRLYTTIVLEKDIVLKT